MYKSKTCFLLVIPLLLICGSHSFGASNCASIDNDIARLQCYDQREKQNSQNSNYSAETPIQEQVVELPEQPAVTEVPSSADIQSIPPSTVPIDTQPVTVTKPRQRDEVESEASRRAGADQIGVDAAENVTETETESPVVIIEQPQSPQPQVVERIIYRDGPEPALEEIRSTITDIRTPLSRRKEFRLENGQRWQETREYGLQFDIGSEVYLKKGYFNGYNMTSGRNTVRVARVD